MGGQSGLNCCQLIIAIKDKKNVPNEEFTHLKNCPALVQSYRRHHRSLRNPSYAP